MSDDSAVPVHLYIYDLTNGLASLLSPAILGQQIEGVWHTSIVVYDREYFYGAGGVTSCAPGSTMLGAPHQVERLGVTFVPFALFVDYIQGLATTTYTGSSYQLLEHNCNHFSDEVAQFACGARVPKHIIQQPEALPAQLRAALAARLADLVPPAGSQAVYANGVRHVRQPSPDYVTLNDQIEEARVQSAELEQRRSTLAEKLARKERKREKKRKKLQREQDGARLGPEAEAEAEEEAEADRMSEVAECPAPVEAGGAAVAGPSTDALRIEAEERRREEQRRRERDPPIVFTDIDGAHEFEQLAAALGELPAEQRQSLEELRQYLVEGEGSWVLGDEFLAFVGAVLETGSGEARARALRCLGACALREDVALVLHQDRRHHALLNYAHRVDALPPREQAAVALFFCNLFENVSSSEWLVYISEWEVDGQPLSNIRVTTKVAVHSALSEEPEVRAVGTALLHNLATKEVKTVVFDDVCVELAMALLQLLQLLQTAGGESEHEEHVFRAVKALARLAHHSPDVPQLVALVGPDPAAYRGTSPRVDEQIDLILKKLK